MASHKPITTEQAQRIAEEHDKSIIIILAYDPAAELMHATTYGVSPRDKEWAAQGGEIAITALGASVEAATSPEDYRITQAKDLLVALKSAIKIANDAFEAWDSDNDMRCGKILRCLGDPKVTGYRGDIDAIHETVRIAEAFLGV